MRGFDFPFIYINSKSGKIDMNNVYANPRMNKKYNVKYVYLTINNKESGMSYRADVIVNGVTKTMYSSGGSSTGTQTWACNVEMSGTLTDRYITVSLGSGTSSNITLQNISTIPNVEYFFNSPSTPSSVNFLDTDISKPIRIQFSNDDSLSNAKRVYIFYDSSNRIYKDFINISNNIVTLPPNTITDVNLYKMYGCHGYYESWASNAGYYGTGNTGKSYTLTKTVPSIQMFTCSSSNIDTGIAFSWQPISQMRYELEVYQDGVLIYSKSENSPITTVTMPSSYLRNTNLVTAKLRIAYIAPGYENDTTCYVYSDYRETNLTPTYSNPTVTNINTIGDYYEKNITVNWRGEYQTNYEYECYYNNTKVKNGTGGTEQTFIIPANTFVGTLPASVRVKTIRTVNGQTLYSSWQERSISLKEITPTIANISLSGSNIDLPITISWESTDQQGYEVKIGKDSSTVKTYTGTTDTSVTIPGAMLTTGLHNISVRVSYSNRWSDWKTITATLIETLPSIGAFEPDGVIVERDNPIRVWWTSNNQTKWTLQIDDILTYSGTSAKEHLLSPATLQTGNHSMVLTVTYVTGTSVEKSVSKKAEFIVQGKPPIPTITSSNTFTSNRPLISWDTQDQQGYILDVLKNGVVVYTTDWQNGLFTEHKVMDYLENGIYTVRVKVMNQYSLESDYGSKQITINTIENTPIVLNSKLIENGVYLWWDNQDYTFDTYYLIRNDVVIAKINDTIYYDYTAHGECTYVIRGINASDVYKDSNSVIVNVSIHGGLIATIDRLDDMMNIGISRSSHRFDGNIDISHSLVHLTGRELPVGVFGEHRSGIYNLKFSTRDNLFRFLEMCYKRQVFCYRDKRQILYLTIPNPQYSVDKFGMEYTIQANEVDYSEVIDYD